MPGFRRVPRTGVIYVMHRAAAAGHGRDGRTWYNLGQGSPDVGSMPGAPPRRDELHIDPRRQTYAPVDGTCELRDRVAELYNFLYRRNKRSRYSRENVSIAPGGRPAMTRIAAAMGEMNLGHFIPDYTAYEELLSAFKGFIPIPILLDAAHGYRASRRLLLKEIVGRGLSALWCSNPCNPTGQLVEGEALAEWVEVARDNDCTFILDEFYSHYIYTPAPDDCSEIADTARMVSAAAHVEDVNSDPIILVDGLTKNWRYPGWRVSWIVGPRTVIDRVTSAGSFLDGGGNHPFQEAAVPLLEPELVLQETTGDPDRVRPQAPLSHRPPTRSRNSGRARTPGRLLRVGQPRGFARPPQRRHRVLQGAAPGPGDHRARRVLRRESRPAAPQRPLPQLLPAQLRPLDGDPGTRRRADREADPRPPLSGSTADPRPLLRDSGEADETAEFRRLRLGDGPGSLGAQSE